MDGSEYSDELIEQARVLRETFPDVAKLLEFLATIDASQHLSETPYRDHVANLVSVVIDTDETDYAVDLVLGLLRAKDASEVRQGFGHLPRLYDLKRFDMFFLELNLSLGTRFRPDEAAEMELFQTASEWLDLRKFTFDDCIRIAAIIFKYE